VVLVKNVCRLFHRAYINILKNHFFCTVIIEIGVNRYINKALIILESASSRRKVC
jgi:hypothetical protein